MGNETMKIFFVLHGFPPETTGGTERTTEAMARALMAEGHEVTVVAGSLRIGRPQQIEVEDLAGLRVLRLHRDDLYFESWWKTWQPTVSASLEELFAAESPDFVCVQHWLRLTSDIGRIARRHGAVVAVTANDYFPPLAQVARRFGTEELLPQPDYMNDGERDEALALHGRDFLDEFAAAHLRFAPSKAHADAVSDLLPGDPGVFSVMPPPLLSPPSRLAGQPQSGGRRLVTWGALYPGKGLETVLRAMRQLQDQPFSLQVLGQAHDPLYALELEALADGLQVTFSGSFDAADLSQLEADYAVLPSECHESYGMVLDEAACLGLPMLVADLPAYREHAVVEAVAFFEPGNVDSLVHALRHRGALAPPGAPQLVTAEQAARRLLRCYNEVDRQAASQRPSLVSDRDRAEMLFRRLERRTWTALNAKDVGAPPGDWLK